MQPLPLLLSSLGRHGLVVAAAAPILLPGIDFGDPISLGGRFFGDFVAASLVQRPPKGEKKEREGRGEDGRSAWEVRIP